MACSCSFAVATSSPCSPRSAPPPARGLLIKGGRYLEALAKADVLLVDKTGPLTLGRPQITDTAPLDGRAEEALLHGESRTVRSGPR
ncbi:hypothetical protein ACH4VM_35400 [Streptomyces sp. NPDC020792]|uniref:hypothetical protein n=1 Tax=Streptomyces sp. NPDC020792 TaxID=3365089 RepID=UPI00379148BB